MEADVITAPFTAEQQAALNAWQTRGAMHPFTCPNESTPLYAGTVWYCRHCSYTQDWAHAFMAEEAS